LALAPGVRLGVYEITAQIGEGGMGAVYRATDTSLSRQVAIKVLPEAFAADPDRLARFEREAKTLASLNHPHIAAIHAVEKSGGTLALVMELVEGEDLSQRIARGAIPIDEALPIATQIAEALEAAHEQGIIHRDLKPANIKVRSDGTVKVLDFGLAKGLDRSGEAGGSGRPGGHDLSASPTLTSPAMTQAGIVLGTAAYMSPEQAKGRPVDRRADIWAFGAVLYEMLAGTRAFPGEDVTDTIVSVMSKEPDFAALPADVPARVIQALRVCLRKDAKQRAGDIRDVRLALEGAFETAAPQTNTFAQPAAPRGRLAWGVAIVAVLTAVALAVPAVRYVRQAPRQADTLVRFSVAAPAGARRITAASTGLFNVAPDGQTLVFGGTGADGVSRLFVRRLDATEAQPVAGTELATVPFWAPDGRSLGFAKEGGLYRVVLDGSAPRRICDIGAAFLGGTWSARGVIVFATQTTGLLQVPDTGGKPTPVTTLDRTAKEAAHVRPWFLPDGRHVLFLAVSEVTTRGTIWATAIDDPGRTRIVESSGGAAYAAGWLLSTTTAPPRSLVAQPFDSARLTLQGTPQLIRDQLPNPDSTGRPGFAVSSSGVLVIDRPPPIVSQLVWMDRSGRALGTASPRASLTDFALAPDERRVVAAMRPLGAATGALWLFDELRPEGTRLTYEGRANRPLWALDSRHIYFTGTDFVLSTLAIGATAPTAFEQPGPFVHFEDVTRDGRYLVFKSLKAPFEVWIQRVGSGERRVLVQGQFAASRARVSPDSRWLAYTLELPPGLDVFAQPFDRPGDRTQVSAKGGFGPVWRDDGRELYYEGPEGLMAVPMNERGGVLEAGTPQRLFAIRTQGNVVNQPHNFEVAAHGQKFLVNTIVEDSDNAPLEVTLHWDAGLTK
jgi:Tol biopolymer transport system component